MPKVSVIMPVYNTSKFLKESIESILFQDFQDFEFIILDDASTDNSYEILEQYAWKFPNIKLIRNEKNKWISYTRNLLISQAQTDFIATQDSDDISLPWRLRIQYEFLLNNPDFWAVSGNNIIIDEDWTQIWYRKYSDNISDVILKKSPLSNPSSLFRKNIFEKLWGYEEWLNYGEDYDLWLKMYYHWYKLKNIDVNFLKLRIRAWQTKSDKLKQTLKNTIYLQEKYVRLWIKASVSDKIYLIFEKILYLFPKIIILWLFKTLEYQRWK